MGQLIEMASNRDLEVWQWPEVKEIADKMLIEQEQLGMEQTIIQNILNLDAHQQSLSVDSSVNSYSENSDPEINEKSPTISDLIHCINQFKLTTSIFKPQNSKQHCLPPAFNPTILPPIRQPQAVSSVSHRNLILDERSSSLLDGSLFKKFDPQFLPLSSTSNRSRRNSRSQEYCGFCKTNGEHADIFMYHRLKDEKGRVVCPQLRVLTCVHCGASGDNAHTESYCPMNKLAGKVTPLPTMLKNTAKQSDGRWRKRRSGR